MKEKEVTYSVSPLDAKDQMRAGALCKKTVTLRSSVQMSGRQQAPSQDRGLPVPQWQLVAAASSAPAPTIVPNWPGRRHFSVPPVPQILWGTQHPLFILKAYSSPLACQCHFPRAGNQHLPSDGTTSGLGFVQETPLGEPGPCSLVSL